MRLPLIHPSALDPVQKDLYDDMRAGIATGFNGFRTALDDGSMIGPWNASLHSRDRQGLMATDQGGQRVRDASRQRQGSCDPRCRRLS
jgi:hypothetical protein